MADDTAGGRPMPGGGTTTPEAAEALTAEVIGSTESYRRLGEIFISVLAAVPAATLLTSLIRAPGEEGLNGWRLGWGLTCGSVALLASVWLAVRMRQPVEIELTELKRFDINRVLGTRQKDVDGLLERIDQLQQARADARSDAERADAERGLRGVLRTLESVHLLATADKLRERVTSPLSWLLVTCAVAASALAVFFLATAVNSKAADSPMPVVKVTLTPAGAKQLGCPITFTALKLAGSDAEPYVVPMDGTRCTAGVYLKLKTGKEPIAEVEPLTPLATSTASPTATP
ncbi:hypothetical protein K7B10_38135 [Streptomyces flavotricini]|uniref:Uncharacterized protein n=1 Tax=Streptomyces flavotricini TaxID=66888 RepID=A0ABS8EJ41_9ACTN|nr:hypothetical protein [Streptomyces flavotricini]MCC0100492.1 hypothetical protein [Streptomyces flavotricini]